MRRTRWFIFLLAFSSSLLKAQDQTNFTHFYLNPYLFNPSYAGIDGQAALSFIYRKQWMNIDGGPTIANVSLHTPVTPRVSFGLSVTNDSKGLLNNSAALISFGYNIPLAEKSFLRFGISGGGTWNTIDLNKLEALNGDPALGNIIESNAALTGNAGISFHINTFQLGASMPTMFAPSYVSEDAFSITEIKPFQSIVVNASNRFYFADDKHIFEPYVLYRINADLPPQFEVAGVLHLNHMVWLGGSYKQDFGISALGGLKLKNTFGIAASYSLQNTGMNELNSPGFEIGLNLLLGKRRKNTPLYSFVNAAKEKEKKPIRKSASEQIAEKRRLEEEARKKREEDLARKKKEAEETRKKDAELAAVRQQQAEEERQRQEEERRRQEEELARNTRPVEPVEPERKDDPVVVEQPVEEKKPEPQPAIDGRHETYKRGTHSNELMPGNFVIVGAFSSQANAERYTRGLVQLGYLAGNGHLTAKNLWYVYIHRSDDMQPARTERDKYRKLRMFKDAWILTVEQ